MFESYYRIKIFDTNIMWEFLHGAYMIAAWFEVSHHARIWNVCLINDHDLFVILAEKYLIKYFA